VSVPGESWIDKVRQNVETEAEGWFSVRGLTRTEAERLLDWLEVRSCQEREMTLDSETGFTVRWRG
jgi:hypothetical protein